MIDSDDFSFAISRSRGALRDNSGSQYCLGHKKCSAFWTESRVAHLVRRLDRRGIFDHDRRFGNWRSSRIQCNRIFRLRVRRRDLFDISRSSRFTFSQEADSSSKISVVAVKGVNSSYFQRIMNNVLNPKMPVLFASLMPQFISPGRSAAPDLILLGLVFAAVGLCALTAYALLASLHANLFRQSRLKKALDSKSGVVLVAPGIKVLVD